MTRKRKGKGGRVTPKATRQPPPPNAGVGGFAMPSGGAGVVSADGRYVSPLMVCPSCGSVSAGELKTGSGSVHYEGNRVGCPCGDFRVHEEGLYGVVKEIADAISAEDEATLGTIRELGHRHEAMRQAAESGDMERARMLEVDLRRWAAEQERQGAMPKRLGALIRSWNGVSALIAGMATIKKASDLIEDPRLRELVQQLVDWMS